MHILLNTGSVKLLIELRFFKQSLMIRTTLYGSNRQRFPPCQHQYLSQFLRTSNKILQPSGKKYL